MYISEKKHITYVLDNNLQPMFQIISYNFFTRQLSLRSALSDEDLEFGHSRKNLNSKLKNTRQLSVTSIESAKEEEDTNLNEIKAVSSTIRNSISQEALDEIDAFKQLITDYYVQNPHEEMPKNFHRH